MNALTSIGYSTKTIEEVKMAVPAAFSKIPAPERSEHYSFVSTEELLNSFDKLNWKPYSSKQNGLSIYARHMVRLNNDGLGFINIKNDRIKPQIILDNSHNGGSCAQIHMGLFRLVCSNGLVVAMPGMHTSIKFRHMGVNFEELKELTEKIADQYNEIAPKIENMQGISMSKEKAEDFVIKAMAYREPAYFVSKEDNTIMVEQVLKSINPADILKPIREEDAPENLWNIFNLVQERMVKGEFERKSLNTGRISHPRPLTGAIRNLKFNKILWNIAEDYFETSASIAPRKVMYTSAKGNPMEVEILKQIDNKLYQVKNNNSIFVVNANRLAL